MGRQVIDGIEYPRAVYRVRDMVWIESGRALDETTGAPRFVVGSYVPMHMVEHELARLRAWDEPAKPRFSKEELDKLDYDRIPPLRSRS